MRPTARPSSSTVSRRRSSTSSSARLPSNEPAGEGAIGRRSGPWHTVFILILHNRRVVPSRPAWSHGMPPACSVMMRPGGVMS